MCYRAAVGRFWRALGRATVIVLGLFALGLLARALEPLPRYAPEQAHAARPFDEFYRDKLQASAQAGVGEGNEERLLRVSERSDLAILYIHGFGASRADGEYVVERLAEAARANTYFMRLPGHGSRMQDLERHAFDSYVRAAEEALREVGQLGRRVVVIGTSLGGLLSTYLAAAHPERVAALVLFSPFYEYVGMSKLVNLPIGIRLATWIEGPVRSAEQPATLGARVHPDYPEHWYTREFTSSLRVVRDLKRFAARKEVFERVRCPVLLFYDPQDDVANALDMHAAFASFARDPRSREVRVDYGNHILASAYLETDKPLILREARSFLETLARTLSF